MAGKIAGDITKVNAFLDQAGLTRDALFAQLLLMLPKEDTTYARMAARQSQQQRIRNADALARARSVARHTGNR